MCSLPPERLHFCVYLSAGGLFPTDSNEYEVFRCALSQHQEVPKLVPQVDMVDTGSSFAMTYACKSLSVTYLGEFSVMVLFSRSPVSR